MGPHTASEVFAPLLGAAVFAGMVGYGFLTGKMPVNHGPDPGKQEMAIGFWALAAIYAVGCVGCLIWFVVVLLS